MILFELLAGLVLLAFASLVFWRIGQVNALSLRWRNSLGMESLLVLVVLGGWAGGASFVIHFVATVLTK